MGITAASSNKQQNPELNTTVHNDRSFISKKRSAFIGFLAFIILAFLIGAFIYQRYASLRKENDQEALLLGADIKARLQESLASSLSATKTLSFFIQKDGSVKDFDSVAAQLMAPGSDIDAVELVPGGVIKYIYPLKGNETAINYDVLADADRRREALKAIQKKEMFFAGPFELKQGGMGVVGRLPVFRNEKFWGFTAVVIRLQTLLKAAGVDSSQKNGYYFQLSKINPSTGREEFFIPHTLDLSQSHSVSVSVPNGEWKLSIVPAKKYKDFGDILLLLILGSLFAVLGGFVVYNVAGRPRKLNDLVKERTMQLRVSEENYKILFEKSPLPLWIYDLDTFKFMEVNDAAINLYGYSKEEFLERDVLSIRPKEDIDKFFEDNQYIPDELREAGVWTHLKKSLEEIQVLIFSRNIFYKEKKGRLVLLMDVSEKIKVENELLKSEEKYRSLIKHASDGIVITDLSGTIREVNKSMCNLLGYDPREMIGRHLQEFIPQGDHEKNPLRIKELLEGKSVLYERQYVKKDGSLINVEVNAKKASSDTLIGFIRNISERLKADEDLKKSNERFELIAHATNEAVWDHDFIKNETWGNQKLLDLYGFDITERKIDFQLFLSHVHPDERKAVEERMTEAIRKQETSLTEEIRFRVAGGGYRNFYDRAYIKYDDSGKPLRILGAMQDITEKEIARKQILKEKELSDSIINSLPGIFYLYNTEGKFRRWNKNFEKMTGYHAEEIAHLHPLDLFDTKDHPLLSAKISNVFIAGEDHVEADLLLKNRQKIPFYFTGRAIHYEGESCLMGVGLDFSDKEKAKREIYESETKYQELIEQASDGIFISDKQGKYIDVNTSACRMLGYTKEELLNMTGADVLYKKEDIKELPNRYGYLHSGKSNIKETTLKRKDGSPLEAESNSKMLPDGRFIGIVRDLSERKKADQAIRESEERYRALVDNATEALVVLDANKQKFVNVSESAITLFKYTREQLLDLGPGEVSAEFQPDGGSSAALIAEKISRAANGEKICFEWTLKDRNNELIPSEIWLVRLPSDTEVLIRGTIIDITERKKAAEEIKTNAELLRELYSNLQNIREEERKHIAREIHDELGQQLTGLKMDIFWINRRLKTDDELIREKMVTTLNLIDTTIKTVRKIATELRPSILDDLGLVAALEWQGEEFEKRSDIKVKFTSSLNDTIVLPNIATALFRIYQELLTNVARHSKAANVKTSIYPDNFTLYLKVTDDGAGFNMEGIEGKKTLGLRGIQERTNLIGGTCEIKSKPGEGTYVLISVPLLNPNAKTK